MPTEGPLVDRFGRVHDDLRISVTDRCNLRCTYCMPEEGMTFLPRTEVLSFDEIVRVAGLARSLGVSSIRLTGGEPLVRKGLPALVGRLSALRFEDLALTTNGMLLGDQAGPLAGAGLHRVNISCDSLRPDRFTEIRHRGDLDTVLTAMDAAEEAGLRTAQGERGARPRTERRRDPGLCRLRPGDRPGRPVHRVHATRRPGSMGPRSAGARTGGLRPHFGGVVPRSRQFSPEAAPAERFRFVDGGGEIGLISSVTQPFCGTCNRLRLTADGAVRNCLFSDDEHQLRDLLRTGGTDSDLPIAVASGGLGQASRARHQRSGVPSTGSIHVDDRGLAVAHLRLFGPAREAAGVSRADVAGCTVGQVLTAAESRYGAAFAGVLAASKIWVNGESATTAVPGDRRRRSGRHPPGVGRMTPVGPSGAEDGRLTHVDEHGKAHMVDVTGKTATLRIAEARCSVRTSADVSAILADPAVGSDLLEAARFSGILAAKQTSSLVPLCHPIRLDGVAVDVRQAPDGFRIAAEAAITDRTGVEMEALTACTAAALVLLQPLLAVDPLDIHRGADPVAQDRWPLRHVVARRGRRDADSG